MTSDQGSRAGLPFPMPWQFWGPAHPHMKGFPLRDFGAVLTDQVWSLRLPPSSRPTSKARPAARPTASRARKMAWCGVTAAPDCQLLPQRRQLPSYEPSTTAGAVDQGKCQAVHLQLINAAQQTLMVYNEEMADSQIVSAIAAAAQHGVQVRILLTGNVTTGDGGAWVYESASQYSQLAAAGADPPVLRWPGPHVHPRQGPARRCRGGKRHRLYGLAEHLGNSLTSIASWGFSSRVRRDTALFIETFNSDWATEGLCSGQRRAESDTGCPQGAAAHLQSRCFRQRADASGTDRAQVVLKNRGRPLPASPRCQRAQRLGPKLDGADVVAAALRAGLP